MDGVCLSRAGVRLVSVLLPGCLGQTAFMCEHGETGRQGAGNVWEQWQHFPGQAGWEDAAAVRLLGTLSSWAPEVARSLASKGSGAFFCLGGDARLTHTFNAHPTLSGAGCAAGGCGAAAHGGAGRCAAGTRAPVEGCQGAGGPRCVHGFVQSVGGTELWRVIKCWGLRYDGDE